MRLLLGQPDGRFDVDHQVLIARARQTLHQFFQLASLHRHFAEPEFRNRQSGRGFKRLFLRLFGHRPSLERLQGRVGGLPGKLFTRRRKSLPKGGTCRQRERRQRKS